MPRRRTECPLSGACVRGRSPARWRSPSCDAPLLPLAHSTGRHLMHAAALLCSRGSCALRSWEACALAYSGLARGRRPWRTCSPAQIPVFDDEGPSEAGRTDAVPLASSGSFGGYPAQMRSGSRRFVACAACGSLGRLQRFCSCPVSAWRLSPEKSIELILRARAVLH